MGQRRVAALQVGERRVDRGGVAIELDQERFHARRTLARRQCFDVLADLRKTGRREQLQHQGQRQVFLHRVDAEWEKPAGVPRGKK